MSRSTPSWAGDGTTTATTASATSATATYRGTRTATSVVEGATLFESGPGAIGPVRSRTGPVYPLIVVVPLIARRIQAGIPVGAVRAANTFVTVTGTKTDQIARIRSSSRIHGRPGTGSYRWSVVHDRGAGCIAIGYRNIAGSVVAVRSVVTGSAVIIAVPTIPTISISTAVPRVIVPVTRSPRIVEAAIRIPVNPAKTIAVAERTSEAISHAHSDPRTHGIPTGIKSLVEAETPVVVVVRVIVGHVVVVLVRTKLLRRFGIVIIVRRTGRRLFRGSGGCYRDRLR